MNQITKLFSKHLRFVFGDFANSRERKWQLLTDFGLHFAPSLPHLIFLFIVFYLSNSWNVALGNLMVIHLVILESFIVYVLKIVVLWVLSDKWALCNCWVLVVIAWLLCFAWKTTNILVIYQFRMGIKLSHKWRWKGRLTLCGLRDWRIILVTTRSIRQVDLTHLSTKRIRIQYGVRCTLVWGVAS